MPDFLKLFIRDALEGALAALLALNVAAPHNLQDVKALLIVAGTAVLAAVVAAARREAPDALQYVLSKITALKTQ